MPRNLTQEEFIRKASSVVGAKYCLSDVKYVSARTKIDVRCYDHGHFSITPNNLLSGKGCPSCAKSARGKAEREKTGQDFMQKCLALEDGKYTFGSTKYLGAEHLVTITCKEHGDFEIIPHNFLKGKGCQVCGRINRGMNNRLSEEEFRLVVQDANPKYSPSNKTKYTNYSSQTYFNCYDHGEFQTRACTLLAGRGCPGCTSQGYRVGRQGTLYILISDSITKVGITNRLLTKRLAAINRKSPVKFSQLREFTFEDGSIPLKLETALLRELRTTHKQPTEIFDGSTECFYDVDHDWLLSRIEQLIKEFTNDLGPQ